MTTHPRYGARPLFVIPATILSDRQQQVLELLQANPGGLRSTDVGRYLHMARNAPCACAASTDGDSTLTTCRWAMSDGQRIGTQLRRLDPPLVIKRRSGLWELLPAARPHDTGTFPDTY